MRGANFLSGTAIATAGAMPATFVAALAYLFIARTNESLGDTIEFAFLVTLGLVRQTLLIGAAVGVVSPFGEVRSPTRLSRRCRILSLFPAQHS